MFRVKLPSAVPLLVLSCLYLISLGCGGSLPGSLPPPAPQNGSAGAASVSIVPAVVVTVAPAHVSATAGATQQFAASVTGTSNTGVAWTVSGTGCSGTACRTISSNGLYTAPAEVPAPANVTITATSMSNPTQSAQSNVTIVPSFRNAYYLATAADGGNDSNDGLTPGASETITSECGMDHCGSSLKEISNRERRWGSQLM
jgi:hypothetical protein